MNAIVLISCKISYRVATESIDSFQDTKPLRLQDHEDRTDDEWHGFPAPVLDKRLADGRRAALGGLHCSLWLFSLPLPLVFSSDLHTTERSNGLGVQSEEENYSRELHGDVRIPQIFPMRSPSQEKMIRIRWSIVLY